MAGYERAALAPRRRRLPRATASRTRIKDKDTPGRLPCLRPNPSPSPSPPHTAHHDSPSPHPRTPPSLARDQVPCPAASVPTIRPYLLRSLLPDAYRPYLPMDTSNLQPPPCDPHDVTPLVLSRARRE